MEIRAVPVRAPARHGPGRAGRGWWRAGRGIERRGDGWRGPCGQAEWTQSRVSGYHKGMIRLLHWRAGRADSGAGTSGPCGHIGALQAHQKRGAVRPQTGSAVRPQIGSAVRPQTGSAVRPQTGSAVRPQTGIAVRPQTGITRASEARHDPGPWTLGRGPGGGPL